jgi:hypothetical protein
MLNSIKGRLRGCQLTEVRLAASDKIANAVDWLDISKRQVATIRRGSLSRLLRGNSQQGKAGVERWAFSFQMTSGKTRLIIPSFMNCIERAWPGNFSGAILPIRDISVPTR